MAPIGSVWDTGAGNHWEVVEHFPNDRVRVRCVFETLPGRKGKALEGTFVWFVGTLTGCGSKRLR